MFITCLEPNLSRARAAQILKRPARLIRRGQLEVVMDFYVPYRLFEMRVRNAGRIRESIFAVDSITGNLDLYSFDSDLAGQQRAVIETKRAVQAGIGEPESFTILREKIERREYLKGFFKVKSLEVSGRCIADLHLPYWVGVYRRKDRATVEVIDALRGSLEGAKLREIVIGWFQSGDRPEAEDG